MPYGMNRREFAALLAAGVGAIYLPSTGKVLVADDWTMFDRIADSMVDVFNASPDPLLPIGYSLPQDQHSLPPDFSNESDFIENPDP